MSNYSLEELVALPVSSFALVQILLRKVEELCGVRVVCASELPVCGMNLDEVHGKVVFVYMDCGVFTDFVSRVENFIMEVNNLVGFEFECYDLQSSIDLYAGSNPVIFELCTSRKKFVETSLFTRYDFSVKRLYNHYRGLLNSLYRQCHGVSVDDVSLGDYHELLGVCIRLEYITTYDSLPPDDPFGYSHTLASLDAHKLLNRVVGGWCDEVLREVNVFVEGLLSVRGSVGENVYFLRRVVSSYFGCLYDYFVSVGVGVWWCWVCDL